MMKKKMKKSENLSSKPKRRNKKTVRMLRLPKCDFCHVEAMYDAYTKEGHWAYMCQRHYEEHYTPMPDTNHPGFRLVARRNDDEEEA